MSSNSAAASGSGAADKPQKSLFDRWFDGDDSAGMVSTKYAKQVYFLATDDLSMLPCERFGGGIGCGPPMKCYGHMNLVQASLDKHGRAGIEKKLGARHKRDEKKRLKERQAELARKRMKTINDNVANTANNSTGALATKPAADTTEIKKLRGSILKLAKKNMGFEMSGAPKHWRFEVPGTSKATFAALMGQPNDVELTTFVKNGAYYTIERYDVTKLFGVKNENQLTKQFKREGVGQKIGSTAVVRYKPSTMELSVTGYAEISCDW